MQAWIIQIGVVMNQDELMQIKEDVERLVSDLSKLTQNHETSCTQESDHVTCQGKSHMRCNPLMCLSFSAVLGGLVGALLVKNH